MKRIQWLGTSLNAVREFPADARVLVGQELRLVQSGLMPSDFKPMLTVGAGAYEIRVRAGNQYRVIMWRNFRMRFTCFIPSSRKHRRHRNLIEPPRLSWRPVGLSQTVVVC
jgi:phage-related protein